MNDSSLPVCLQQIQTYASSLVKLTSSPVKIGIMGEFNAGKTLLLGNLIGYADALPISEIPTTGNVTAIHLRQQNMFETTQFTGFTVEYLSNIGVKECLNFMLDEAQQRSRSTNIPSDLLQQLTQIRAEVERAVTLRSEVIEVLLEWSEKAWDRSQNPELRYLLREIVIFLRSYSAYGRVLVERSYEVDRETVLEGLKLANLPEIQSLEFEQLPKTPIELPQFPKHLNSQLLQQSFSLIARIRVNVSVSKEIWNLSGLEGLQELVLIDFPGLGAANSGARDTFLSLSELAEVQTILILLNSRTPGNDRANRIFTLMERGKQGQDLKDRILVGVGRFDQLPEEMRVLDQLIDLPDDDSPFQNLLEPEPLSEPEVLQQLKALDKVLTDAYAFTARRDQVVLLSPMIGLKHQSEQWSTLQAGSEEFLANLVYVGSSIKQAQEMRAKWEKLGKRLLQTEPRSLLGRQLLDFAFDGGVSRLRSLLGTHIAQHGLKHLSKDVDLAWQNLQREGTRLATIQKKLQLQDIPIVDSDSILKLRDILQNLVKIYSDFRDQCWSEPLQDSQRGVPVSDVVYEELTFEVFRWEQWNLLFHRANEQGIIELPKFTKGILIDIDPTLDQDREDGIPNTSDEFFPVFENTFYRVARFACDRTQAAVVDRLNTLSYSVEQWRELLEEVLPADQQSERVRQIRQKNKNAQLLQILLGVSTHPERLQAKLFQSCELQAESLPGVKAAELFPLAQRDRTHPHGQFFDWALDKPKSERVPADNEVLVLRLRDEMISCAGVQLVQFVSEKNQKVNEWLNDVSVELINALQTLLRDEALLRDIVTDHAATQQQTHPLLGVLSQLTSLISASKF